MKRSSSDPAAAVPGHALHTLHQTKWTLNLKQQHMGETLNLWSLDWLQRMFESIKFHPVRRQEIRTMGQSNLKVLIDKISQQ